MLDDYKYVNCKSSLLIRATPFFFNKEDADFAILSTCYTKKQQVLDMVFNYSLCIYRKLQYTTKLTLCIHHCQKNLSIAYKTVCSKV